ncbi:hypothetical protein EGW08_010415 [Elysia chlorotica]|uniref:Uncharacterized protein n=1 Tax=Elysia chlorotica TaxID=188477 RepID=A0A3S0ZLM4_ELYCH|nr:hypothetical protein EGW08_010415 [Elysia chlorotica]
MELRHVLLHFKKRRPARKSDAEYQAEYRQRLQSNPKQWEKYKERQKAYMKRHLNNLSEDEKHRRREKKSQRQRENRKAKREARKKEAPLLSAKENRVKKTTRNAVQDPRSYWRERKRIQRAAMSDAERKATRMRENERRRLKKSMSCSASSVPPTRVSENLTAIPIACWMNESLMQQLRCV